MVGYFNPRPPRGGRQKFENHLPTACNFNPRPPRGGRHDKQRRGTRNKKFQSTPPARGATCRYDIKNIPLIISIHAPREGGDREINGRRCYADHFNPRPPRGGRPRQMMTNADMTYFNPRPPRGGRLHLLKNLPPFRKFQSTPPARGATKLLVP